MIISYCQTFCVYGHYYWHSESNRDEQFHLSLAICCHHIAIMHRSFLRLSRIIRFLFSSVARLLNLLATSNAASLSFTSVLQAQCMSSGEGLLVCRPYVRPSESNSRGLFEDQGSTLLPTHPTKSMTSMALASGSAAVFFDPLLSIGSSRMPSGSSHRGVQSSLICRRHGEGSRGKRAPKLLLWSLLVRSGTSSEDRCGGSPIDLLGFMICMSSLLVCPLCGPPYLSHHSSLL
mmetsp:Transcript_11782/g.26189  ORF Transcript_11782/g.26189 Transcript_11782/m.26189 type:complete len:233 (-) Transcript_11782:1678-2376(-)